MYGGFIIIHLLRGGVRVLLIGGDGGFCKISAIDIVAQTRRSLGICTINGLTTALSQSWRKAVSKFVRWVCYFACFTKTTVYSAIAWTSPGHGEVSLLPPVSTCLGFGRLFLFCFDRAEVSAFPLLLEFHRLSCWRFLRTRTRQEKPNTHLTRRCPMIQSAYYSARIMDYSVRTSMGYSVPGTYYGLPGTVYVLWIIVYLLWIIVYVLWITVYQYVLWIIVYVLWKLVRVDVWVAVCGYTTAPCIMYCM